MRADPAPECCRKPRIRANVPRIVRIVIPVALPPLNEADMMSQFMIEYLSRILGVQGFDVDMSGMLRPG
jgi:hypothetical protein